MPLFEHPGLRVLLAISALGMGHSLADAATPPPEILQSLVDQEFRVRQQAQELLLSWAREDTLPRAKLIFEQSKTAEDPELRFRCNEVLRALAMDEFNQNGEGYLGIQMNPFMVNLPGGNEAPQTVVLITQVMEDSPAGDAGLRAGDMITSINGLTFEEGDDLRAFQQKIRDLKPGQPAKFGIFRDNKDLLEIVVKLGRRPPMLDQALLGHPIEDLHKLARREQDDFFKKWLDELDK